jgi:hypothetical protein
MNRFVARENIKHFRERLCAETDPRLRTRLQKLLVAEEDKLGADLELLRDIERDISDGKRRIERQGAIVANMERDEHNGLAEARYLLESFVEIQSLYETYRQQILIAIEKNGLYRDL